MIPKVLKKYFEVTGEVEDCRIVTKKFHGTEVQLYEGFVHVDDVEGWVENGRIENFLNKWRHNQSSPSKNPTTDEIYKVMISADDSERKMSKKPFKLERLAESIIRNGVQEPLLISSERNGDFGELWDGNRRFYATKHIMNNDKFLKSRESCKWIPALVYIHTSDSIKDRKVKNSIISEMNYVEKDHITWPAYVKAKSCTDEYRTLIDSDPSDASLRMDARKIVAEKFGLSSYKQAERWIKMFELSEDFLNFLFHDEEVLEHEARLFIQDKFEYFDELSKPQVIASLKYDPDSRDEVFRWLWDGKFKNFADVRKVPKVLSDPEARSVANQEDDGAFRRAIDRLVINDPNNYKSKDNYSKRIKNFVSWLQQFNLKELSEFDDALVSDVENAARELSSVSKALRELKGQGNLF